jgi:benzylsuccinate CoA-transferase BbsF subunit
VESAKRPDTLRGGGPFKDSQPGAERSANYCNAQANKLGLSLNLTTEEARRVLLRLVEWADVVVESFATGAMQRWGLDYESLKRARPDLIMLSSNLSGQTGPLATLAGFGTMGAQLAGFGYVTGWPDRPPAGPYVAYTDYVTPKYVACAILAAVEHRRQTGEGQHIDLAQVECSLHFLAPGMLDYFVNGRVQERAGNTSAYHAPHGVYPCAGEDRWVAIACGTEEQWRSLCAVTGLGWEDDSRFATFAARQADREVLDGTLAAWTAPRDPDALERDLQAAGVPVHRATSAADAIADPQLRARGHFATVAHEELGPVVLEAPRIRMSRTDAGLRLPGPMFGQHNEYVLRDLLGMSEEEVVELIVAGALE